MIDLCACEAPSYGKLWLGLHLAIVKDIMDRKSLPSDVANMPTATVIGRKRRPDGDINTRPRKLTKASSASDMRRMQNVGGRMIYYQ